MTNGNRMNGNLLKILLLIGMSLYIGIKDVAAPLIQSVTGNGKSSLVAIVDSDSQRITKLEAIITRLDRIPEIVYAQTEAVNNLKSSVDRLERKLDGHIGK
jgi:hypothetical protein